ncbi:hypothetical protein MNEG_14569, partial [Monoraphidium neglectum]
MPPDGGFLIANAGRTGFYRVNYSEPLWEAFIAAARDENKIPKIDLAGSLDDAFALALDILSTAGLQNATWAACAKALRGYASNAVTGPFLANVAVPNQAAPGLSLAVDPSQPAEVRLLRPAVLLGAGALGDTKVVEAAVQLLVGGGDPHPDVRAAVYKLAVLSGQEEAYET